VHTRIGNRETSQKILLALAEFNRTFAAKGVEPQ
jgi:hypothetical protein